MSKIYTFEEDMVIAILKEYDYALTASMVAYCASKKINEDINKKAANSLLYKMLKNNQVEKLDNKPPTWRLK